MKDGVPMNDRTRGAWILHHAAKLQQVTESGQYEDLSTAGKAGVLLSCLSASAQRTLTNAQVEAFARAHGISAKTEVPTLLGYLEGRRLVSRGTTEVEVLGVTSSKVLEHTAGLFDSLNPTSQQQAAIQMAETISTKPAEKSELLESVSDTFSLSKNEVGALASDCESIGFVDFEKLDTRRTLYFNGNLFRREHTRRATAILATLKSPEERSIAELDEVLRKRGCVPLQEAKKLLGEDLFGRLNAIGMYDINEVQNDSETVAYITRPSAFAKFGNPFVEDAMDLAKAFVTCLTYGMTRSSSGRGQIRMLEKLMKKLIDGSWVGPATAIGQDYKVLELKGVVQLRANNGLYDMKLLKKEVGELALQVLTEGDASEQSLPNLPGASILQYARPEENRTITRRKQTQLSKQATRDLVMAIRTGVG